MGRRVVVLMVASSVFYHTVVGCCAHHAHAQTPTSAATSSSNRAEVGAPRRLCCHRHSPRRSATPASTKGDAADRNGLEQHSSVPHDDSAPCDEASCAFAVAKPATLPADAMKWLPLLALADLAESSTSLISVPAYAATDGQRDVWWPESLRAHLFLQNLRN